MKKKLFLFIILFSMFFISRINAACNEGYKVIYDANGGSGASDPMCVIDTLSEVKPKRSGYKFLGWSTNPNATKAQYYASGYIELTKNTTLYAVWLKGYKITYDVNGGTISSTTKTVYKGYAYGTLLTPTKKGYKFLGWYTEASGGELITNTTIVTSKKAHTIYAHWKKVKYTITYELNNGTNNENNKTSYYITTSTFKLENPTRKGYKFLGWYKDSRFTTKVTYIYKGTYGNKTFYAKWTPIKYNISFYGNTSTSGSTKKQTGLKYNKSYVLTKNGFKKTNYVFANWNTKADGSGKSYDNEATVKNLTSGDGKTVKLYAQWKKKEYKITYVLDGGVNPSNQYKTYTKTSSITLKEPTKEGYIFLGWYTESEFINKVTKIEKGSTGNKTFYAKWKLDAYTVRYVLYGGENPADAVSSYKINEEHELPTPTRKGYSFLGWYKEESYQNKVDSITSDMTGNLLLYAKWKKLTYTITYVLNGGTNPAGIQSTYTVTDEVTLPTPTKGNDIFLGWYTENTFVNEVTKIERGTIGNKTYYAWWDVLETYTISYMLDGGVNPSTAPTTYTRLDEVVLPTPTKTGYRFLGWYTESTFQNRVERIEKKSSGNKTFYAKWEIINYTISYVLNGGSNPSGTVTTYTVNQAITLPKPTKSNYSFGGWYTSYDYSGSPQTSIAKGTTGNKTYYAKWNEVETYTITYNTNGGTINGSSITSYNELTAVTLPTNVTKNGYTFGGWYSSSNLSGSAVTQIPIGTTGNKEFYAKWNAKSYTITYISEGTTYSTGTYTTGTTPSLITPSTSAGRTFKGWYDNSSFTGNAITSIPAGSTGDKIYYAKWKYGTFFIYYVLNGGSNPNSAPLGFTVKDTVTLPTPTRSGYGFIGWYRDEGFTTPISVIPAGTAEDVTVYAKWQVPTTYSITYYLNNGTNPSGAPTTYNNCETLVLPIPTRSGYGFDGWYTNSNLTGSPVTQIERGTTGNKTFYAKWGQIYTYSITYNLNGGINPNGAPTSYTNYDTITLPTPTKEGYTFIGWYTSSNFSGNAITTITKGTTGNKVYYAKWEENILERTYSYIFYNSSYDNILSSQDDLKNAIYNIMNRGLSEVTLTCDQSVYSTYTDCFYDFDAVTQNDDTMKSISDYVNPYNSFETIKTSKKVNNDGSWTVLLKVEYGYSDDDITAIDNKLDYLIANNNIGTMSDANKIKAFHDYLIQTVEYDYDAANSLDYTPYAESFSAYGALLNGLAVCQGYADAMALFLDRYKIPNIRVSSESHTWNLVYINGSWKHLDVTWDDPDDEYGTPEYTFYMIASSALQSLDYTGTHIYITSNYLEAN